MNEHDHRDSHSSGESAATKSKSKTGPKSSSSAATATADEREASTGAERSDRANGAVCGQLPLGVRIEAVLISTDRPVQDRRLLELLNLSGKDAMTQLNAAVEELNEQYEQTGRSFRIERVARGWQMLTLADFGPLLMQLHADRQQSKLSQAALETLAIIAYRQPIMRAEIEAIRGVAAGEVLRGLMERRLVKVAGRAEELGRPMLYGTTSEFLNIFGLASIDDLPAVEGLKREPAYRPPKSKPEPIDSSDDFAANAESQAGTQAPAKAGTEATIEIEIQPEHAVNPTGGSN